MNSNRQEGDNLSISSSLSSTPTERTPLIINKLPNNEKDDTSTWSNEFRWLLKNALPVIFTFLMQNSLQMASIFTLGHLGPTELAAAALASMFASVTAWSIAFGTATALDTLCSQAWTGAKDKTLVGIHLQRALCILALMFIPIAILWWNCTKLLLSLNQDPDLAYHAGVFLRCLMLGAPAFIAFEATKKFLQAQGIMQASTYVLMIVSPLNLVLNYTLVYLPPFQLGFMGAPLATSFSYWLMFILLVCYIRFVKGKEAWGGWSSECLTDWWPFLKLSIPSLLMITAEWWAFELSSLAASYLSTNDLATQSIVLTTASATYTIPFGVSVAASNRIGNALGASLAQTAKIASYITICLAVFFGTLNSTFFMLTRDRIGYLFTSDEDVVRLVSQIIPLCALFQIADGISGVCGGVIRGMGRQSFAAWVNLFSYYVVALPVGYWLTFVKGWGIKGLWIGLTLALFLVATGSLLFLLTADWNHEVRKTQLRVKAEEDRLLEDGYAA
ncbi:mate-domain-containing protein [Cokeromyces recurvatus]|uniref:mate-domain-containing protein n=1 Tax=Cokeromyces recurvatus TaxID=90255 RepID=UPI00221E9B36|nr:mate-domain-containing protein [Cokeromyces recurvatus]KAI7899044.1 mate-domain-containing protein [Cokeromyces recurvatus]